ncbi:DoxX-like family protein [Paenibacillus sp. sgz302251]|uniref:DoxX-like family protein n=1 Tax=Paenibacillus sp. sgz302251 TaxID=3414493 RepID=UPI003C7E0F9E
MRIKPIYVELDMNVSLDELWAHTQKPELHEQWDLRFSKINYLPRTNEKDKQKFLYQTRIGFGLHIAGTGETSSTTRNLTDERLSTLSFASKQPISFIRKGSGYWQYKRNGNAVTFITKYDYQTQFGLAGRLFDRFLFRPLFGYATAWSFDRLRIWLEERIPPSIIAERALIHYVSVFILLLLWCYEGLVPKLLFPETGELDMMRQIGWFDGMERIMVQLLGVGEIVFGLLTAYWHRSRRSAGMQIVLLTLLAIVGIICRPELLNSPFHPLTLSVPMIGLCMASYWTRRFLPNARRCKRKTPGTDLVMRRNSK